MENSKNKCYITEKILHGFAANTIPVYWGSDNINEYFNEDRFINVKSYGVNDITNAINKIILLLNDDNKYLEVVNKPIYKNNRIPFTLYGVSNNIKKLLNINYKPIKKFITFGGPNLMFHRNLERICKEAKDIDFFDEIIGFNEMDLKMDTPFWNKHGIFIETNNIRGYGYWIWKPYLIKKELDKINNGDILIYCDAGCQINKNGKERLSEYIDLLNIDKQNYGIISFQIEFKELLYTKNVIFDFMNSDDNFKNKLQCASTVLIIKKNQHSINIIDKWYDLACNYNLLNDDINNEIKSFVENRHDQSLLSILVNTYGSIKLLDETFFPDNWETEGKQFPFWTKRIKNY